MKGVKAKRLPRVLETCIYVLGRQTCGCTPFLGTGAYVFGDKVTALPRVETGTYILGGQTYGFTPV